MLRLILSRSHGFALALLGAASVATSSNEAAAISAPVASFGAPYTIVTTGARAPRIVGNELRFYASFTGCGAHPFSPVFRRQTMGPIVWFVHTSADRCTKTQLQLIRLTLTADMHQMGLVWLFAPGGDHMMVSLRLGRVVQPGESA